MADVEKESSNERKEMHKIHSRQYVEKKSEEKGKIRCHDCWFDKSSNCICSQLPKIDRFDLNVEFIVYMDHNEYLNPGDDAKLLKCIASNQTDIMIYPHDDDKLKVKMEALYHQDPNTKICVLFPHERAYSFEDYIKFCIDSTSSTSSDLEMVKSMKHVIIIVDAVWRRARKMAAHLHEEFPSIPHVQLSPTQISVYARQQTQSDRICSVEALALYLQCLGEDETVCNHMINSVKINNSSLKRKPQAIVLPASDKKEDDQDR